MDKIDLKLLELLHKNKEDFISGERISQELDVSRTAIWKHIKSLREKGYLIDSSPRNGYCLLKTPERIVPEEIYLGLDTNYMGKEIYVFSSIDSTNEKAKELARAGASTGTVVVAEEQTAGKGRLGRRWFSPLGTGLWFSLIARPEIVPDKAPFLTIIASLAVKEALQGFNLSPVIKWPNDILLNGKKVCGILSELSTDLGEINFAVIGIGLNVNQDNFPPELDSIATSLRLALGVTIERTRLLQSILISFEKYYQKLTEGEFNDLLIEWKKHLNVLNKNVIIYSSDKTYYGKVIDISAKGELIIKDDKGEILSFWAGDVTLRRDEN